ncbi:GxxExxY protein [Candidatus Parcubacteria bacterium]|nr:MAG: GxxExxY protein [Candidatus Parcubacteria bacterium]
MEKDPVTGKIIQCAIEVHRVLGPGLLECVYEKALCIELEERGLNYERQKRIPAVYKGRPVGEYRIDLVVADEVIVEIKSVERFEPVFTAQVLTYMRLTGIKKGLLLNFNSKLLREGVKRYVL